MSKESPVPHHRGCLDCKHYALDPKKEPCKVGDTVYMLCTKSVLETKITEAHISNEICFSTFNVNKHGIANYHGFYADDIGKTVFLTRAAAEKAIEERGK